MCGETLQEPAHPADFSAFPEVSPMPHPPVLARVESTPPRSAFRRGLPSVLVGTAIGVASLVPFLLSVLSR